jgi:hypothetical protein
MSRGIGNFFNLPQAELGAKGGISPRIQPPCKSIKPRLRYNFGREAMPDPNNDFKGELGFNGVYRISTANCAWGDADGKTL